jgi:hypothetical protein
MTTETKREILRLKALGLGYKKIAKELSLTPSAVRCVCTSKYSDPEKYGVCKNCGVKIKMHPGKKKRQFCSDKCRMMWWNSHRDQVNRKAFYTFKCPCCNTEFVVYGNNKRIYCSLECFAKQRKKQVKEND